LYDGQSDDASGGRRARDHGLVGARRLFGGPIWLLMQLVLRIAYAGVLMALWLAQDRPSRVEEYLLGIIFGVVGHHRLAFIERRIDS
jgi:hypothetical protein